MTIYFDGTRPAAPEPRASSLLVSPAVYQMIVVRLQAKPASSAKPAWSAEQRKAAVATILDLVRITHSRALQIDFDAPQSAHPFYRELLGDLRRELDPGVFLSMTALISWCSSPRSWLDGLPVDEIVPMDFATTRGFPRRCTWSSNRVVTGVKTWKRGKLRVRRSGNYICVTHKAPGPRRRRPGTRKR